MEAQSVLQNIGYNLPFIVSEFNASSEILKKKKKKKNAITHLWVIYRV